MSGEKKSSAVRVLRELVAFHERELANVSMPVITLYRLAHLLERARVALGMTPQRTRRVRRDA